MKNANQDLLCSQDHRMKVKEDKRLNKYLDPARELKKLWNIKVTVILIVVGGPWNSPQEPGKETQ